MPQDVPYSSEFALLYCVQDVPVFLDSRQHFVIHYPDFPARSGFLCGSYGFLGIFGQIQHSRIDRKPRVVVVDVGGVVQWSTPLCVIAVVALR